MRTLLIIMLATFMISCQENGISEIDEGLTWTIDTQYLRQGCFDGKDCIPSLQQPERTHAMGSNLTYLRNDDLVVGVWNGTEHVAYPHAILDWHEIVNEDGYTISYCPLTGSALHMSTPLEFGVSGLLFNSNLIMYDRDTDSYWPQMLLRSAAGSRSGGEIHLNNLVETTWGNWKALFPDTQVLNSNTGYSRNYQRYPYGNYKTCNSLGCGDYIYFPVASEDERLPAKQRVLAIIDDERSIAMNIDSYSEPEVISMDVGGINLQVIISGVDNIAVAFETTRTLTIASWDIGGEGIVLTDTGSDKSWDITGQLISNPTPSERLVAANAYIAYWFAVAAFYPDTEIISP